MQRGLSLRAALLALLVGIAILSTGCFLFPKPPANGTVTGKVYDVASGQGIAQATVLIGSTSTLTGTDGHYSLKLPEGTYDWHVTKEGYESRSGSITVIAGTSKELDVGLTPTDSGTTTGEPKVNNAELKPMGDEHLLKVFFSEPLDTSAGVTVILTPENPDLQYPTEIDRHWPTADNLEITYSGVMTNESYRLYVADFQDTEGNAGQTFDGLITAYSPTNSAAQELVHSLNQTMLDVQALVEQKRVKWADTVQPSLQCLIDYVILLGHASSIQQAEQLLPASYDLNWEKGPDGVWMLVPDMVEGSESTNSFQFKITSAELPSDSSLIDPASEWMARRFAGWLITLGYSASTGQYTAAYLQDSSETQVLSITGTLMVDESSGQYVELNGTIECNYFGTVDGQPVSGTLTGDIDSVFNANDSDGDGQPDFVTFDADGFIDDSADRFEFDGYLLFDGYYCPETWEYDGQLYEEYVFVPSLIMMNDGTVEATTVDAATLRMGDFLCSGFLEAEFVHWDVDEPDGTTRVHVIPSSVTVHGSIIDSTDDTGFIGDFALTPDEAWNPYETDPTPFPPSAGVSFDGHVERGTDTPVSLTIAASTNAEGNALTISDLTYHDDYMQITGSGTIQAIGTGDLSLRAIVYPDQPEEVVLDLSLHEPRQHPDDQQALLIGVILHEDTRTAEIILPQTGTDEQGEPIYGLPHVRYLDTGFMESLLVVPPPPQE